MTEKSREKRAIVIGGSMAGLFVAAFLRRIGWRVDIYERSSIELIGRGGGPPTPSSLLGLLLVQLGDRFLVPAR